MSWRGDAERGGLRAQTAFRLCRPILVSITFRMFPVRPAVVSGLEAQHPLLVRPGLRQADARLHQAENARTKILLILIPTRLAAIAAFNCAG